MTSISLDFLKLIVYTHSSLMTGDSYAEEKYGYFSFADI